jgi:predicted MPP superfamily phosphohydrolase
MIKARETMLSRRRFLQLLAGSVLASAGLFGYSRLGEPNWLAVEQITLCEPGLPPHLDGLRFAQISDIHLGEYTSPEQIASAIHQLNNLAPEFVMLTGDYVCRRAQAAQGLVDPLRMLAAPAYAVYGNHDLWSNRDTVGRYLQESGATVLLNQSVEVADGLVLAGLDDVWSGRPDLQTALNHVPMAATVLLMVHEPDYFDQVLSTDAPVAVQFSGHSHGGQVRLPMLDKQGIRLQAPILPRYGQRYPIGLRQVGRRQVYTNRGIGVWPYPIRLNCRPEISMFTLMSTV